MSASSMATPFSNVAFQALVRAHSEARAAYNRCTRVDLSVDDDTSATDAALA
jgi:hypothetical protein